MLFLTRSGEIPCNMGKMSFTKDPDKEVAQVVGTRASALLFKVSNDNVHTFHLKTVKLDVSPLSLEVFYDQAPVAILRRSLTAEQNGWCCKYLLFNPFFNPSVPQQGEKRCSYSDHFPFCLLYTNNSCVGANNGSYRYSMRHISHRKKGRCSFFVKPGSCGVLLSRTSPALNSCLP